jgi:hypothetical protein
MGDQPMTFRLLSEPFDNDPPHRVSKKPATIIIAECDRVWEREPTQAIHHREDEANRICTVCGKDALVWLSSKARHEIHPARCGQENEQ